MKHKKEPKPRLKEKKMYKINKRKKERKRLFKEERKKKRNKMGPTNKDHRVLCIIVCVCV